MIAAALLSGSPATSMGGLGVRLGTDFVLFLYIGEQERRCGFTKCRFCNWTVHFTVFTLLTKTILLGMTAHV